jgi:hypothetical protein
MSQYSINPSEVIKKGTTFKQIASKGVLTKKQIKKVIKSKRLMNNIEDLNNITPIKKITEY